MNHFYFVALLVVISSLPASAQQIAPATSPIKTTNASTQKEPKEIDPEVLQRRSMALLLLQSLAIDARSYRDEPLRARVQARIADALWDQDKEAALGIRTVKDFKPALVAHRYSTWSSDRVFVVILR